MAQSQPTGIYTVEQVRAIARRAQAYPASITARELRLLALHATKEPENGEVH